MYLNYSDYVREPPPEKKLFPKGCKSCDFTGVISFFDPKRKYDRESYSCDCELGKAHVYISEKHGIKYPSFEVAEKKGLKRVKNKDGSVNF